MPAAVDDAVALPELLAHRRAERLGITAVLAAASLLTRQGRVAEEGSMVKVVDGWGGVVAALFRSGGEVDEVGEGGLGAVDG